MADLHIVTATLAAAKPANAPASDAATENDPDAAPFVALLDEHLEAGAALEAAGHVLHKGKIDDELARDGTSDAAFGPTASGLAPIAALVPGERADAAASKPGTNAAHGTRRSVETRRTNAAPTAAEDHARRKAPQNADADGAAALRATGVAGTAAATHAARAAQVHALATTDGATATAHETVTATHGATGPVHAGMATTPAPVATLQQPVGSERWNTELGQNVQMFIHAGQHSATLRVTPADLGPVDVRIDMSGDQATVSFTVQHADTRLALENALPRLRDMLADGGILLGQAHVNQDSRDRHDAPAGSARGRSTDGGTVQAIGGTRLPAATTHTIGLVDTFA